MGHRERQAHGYNNLIKKLYLFVNYGYDNNISVITKLTCTNNQPRKFVLITHILVCYITHKQLSISFSQKLLQWDFEQQKKLLYFVLPIVNLDTQTQ